MEIQFNTSSNIKGSEELTGPLSEQLTTGLSRFSDQITRLIVHLSDQNGNKEGNNDQRCMLEVRLEGMQPIAVTNDANSKSDAVKGAIDKMKSALEKSIGKLKTH